MNQEELNDNIQKWIELSRNGKPVEAERFYYDKLFDSVIENFCNKYSDSRPGELLVSLLGFSPEPIILTAMALKPETHLIISNPVKQEIIDILNDYLEGDFKLVTLEKDDFKTIYKTIKETLATTRQEILRLILQEGKNQWLHQPQFLERTTEVKSFMLTLLNISKTFGSQCLELNT